MRVGKRQTGPGPARESAKAQTANDSGRLDHDNPSEADGTEHPAAKPVGLEWATIAKVAPALLILLLLVKVYGVAHYSLTTATALVTAAPLSVLLGTLALYEYAVMAALAATALLWTISLFFTEERDLRKWAPLALVLGIFTALVTPLFYLRWAGAAFALVLLAWLPLRHRIALSAIAAYVAAAVAAGFVLVTVSNPWLPAEVVMLRQPIQASPRLSATSSILTVFVISEDNGWETMLVDNDRYLVWLPAADVESRIICHQNNQLGQGRTFYQWIIGQPYTSPNVSCDPLVATLKKEAQK
jgi:hypothetical protein